MKVLRNLLVPFLVASCATAPSSVSKPVVLVGVLTLRACPTTDYYTDSYATMFLDSPTSVPGVGQVESVELVLDESHFVRYHTFVGKRGSVTCTSLSASNLCGPTITRVSCGVSHVQVAP